jgi:hypothetical protein
MIVKLSRNNRRPKKLSLVVANCKLHRPRQGTWAVHDAALTPFAAMHVLARCRAGEVKSILVNVLLGAEVIAFTVVARSAVRLRRGRRRFWFFCGCGFRFRCCGCDIRFRFRCGCDRCRRQKDKEKILDRITTGDSFGQGTVSPECDLLLSLLLSMVCYYVVRHAVAFYRSLLPMTRLVSGSLPMALIFAARIAGP